jgi:hypothetical protein
MAPASSEHDMSPPVQTSTTSATRPGAIFVDALALMAVGAVAVAAVRGLSAGDMPPVARGFNTADLCTSIGDAYLSGSVYGAVEQQIEWRGTDMTCDGGLRPGGEGVRVVFAGPGAMDGDRIVVVIGIDGAINELTAAERNANITIIDESSGRFYSSGGQERCWTMVSDATNDRGTFRVTGEAYCTGSLPSVADSSSVRLRGFRYSGRVNVDDS